MLGPTTGVFFPSTRAEFPSDYPLLESVKQLRAELATNTSLFGAAMIGAVTGEDVRLEREVPMVGNLFAQRFIGSFTQQERGVVLTGRFAVRRRAEIYTTLWLTSGVLLSGIAVSASLLGVLLGRADAWLVLIGFVVFGALAFSGMKLGHRFALEDIRFISEAVERALTLPERFSPSPPLPPGLWGKAGRWFGRKFYRLAGQ